MYTASDMAADVLNTHEAGTSTAMVLVYFAGIIPASAPNDLG